MTMNERKRMVAIVLALGLAISVLVHIATEFSRTRSTEAEDVTEIEYTLGTEDALSPFLSSQIMVRESMVSALRANDIDAFCDAYLEFLRIAREEPVIPEGSEPLTSGEGVWVVRLLAIDLYLIPDLVVMSEFCGQDFPSEGF